MIDLISALKDFHVPSLFIIFGFILLLNALGINIFKAEGKNVNKKISAMLGAFFIVAGIVLYAIPSQPKNMQQTATSNPAWNGYSRECEYPDNHTSGQMLQRANASGKKVHGQFGCDANEFKAQAGFVEYRNIRTPNLSNIFLKLRYSKHGPTLAPIEVFFDKEKAPRLTIYLDDQGDWNKFAIKDSIGLGEITNGLHTLILKSKGQDFGVADLDRLELFK